MASYVVNPNDPTTPTNSQGAKQGAEELRALKLKLQAIVAGAFVTTGAAANPADIVTFIQPDPNDRPSMAAGGWLPWSLNQQWGGSPMPFHLIDSATDVESKFDAFDAYIDFDAIGTVGSAAGSINRYQSFIASKNLSIQAIWMRIGKTGNPVDNFTVALWSMAAGIPNALIATANVINGKQITSDVALQWYRFSFAAAQVLVAGTQYMIVFTKSGGVDAANFYNVAARATVNTRYPNNLQGVGTAVPAWTATNTTSINFIVESQLSDQIVQSAGSFNGRIVGYEGNPINRSVGYCKPLREFFPLFHPNGWSILIRGKAWTKDRTIVDFIYGLHHDRINIRSAAGTGFTTVTVCESDNVVTTITGTTDVSTAAFKDILIVGRSMNDAGDYIKIYTGINNVWTKEVESTGLSLIFDPYMLKQGTAWVMGGFQLFPSATYTKLSDMTILPSADGWTFTTTSATAEGSAFAVSGGKLNQIKSGYAAGGDGFYVKAAAAFVNANGSLLASKLRVVSSTNTKDLGHCVLQIEDGTKRHSAILTEYYAQSADTVAQAYPQLDIRSGDSTVLMTQKGSDAFLFVNGKLAYDRTGLLTSASANNQVTFGDNSVTANENADVIWDYVGYYNTSNIYPQFTSGELHEFAIFSGDKNLLGQAIYNLGVPFSIKQYCGLQKNFTGDIVVQKVTVKGITSAPTIAAIAPSAVMPELECFIIGSEISSISQSTETNASAAGTTLYTGHFIDGRLPDAVNTAPTSSAFEVAFSEPIAGFNFSVGVNAPKFQTTFGLHKVERRWRVDTATTETSLQTRRSLVVEARP